MNTDLKVWLDHFEYHATRHCAVPAAKAGNGLTSYERRLIGSSLATFQLGEQSEGRSLLRAAQAYGKAQGDEQLPRIIELLIGEEQHHASILGAYLDEHGLPRKRRDWTDQVFRRVRRLAGFEVHIGVLVAAELIGKIYYRALEAATGCRQLQALCRIIIADELAHIGFESDLIRAMLARKSPVSRALAIATHRMFFSGVALVVWFTHRRVLRGAGYRLRSFLRACAAQYSFYLQAPPLRTSTGAMMR